MYLKGERVQLTRQLEAEMKVAAAHHDFETAARHRNQLNDMRQLQKQIFLVIKNLLTSVRTRP